LGCPETDRARSASALIISNGTEGHTGWLGRGFASSILALAIGLMALPVHDRSLRQPGGLAEGASVIFIAAVLLCTSFMIWRMCRPARWVVDAFGIAYEESGGANTRLFWSEMKRVRINRDGILILGLDNRISIPTYSIARCGNGRELIATLREHFEIPEDLGPSWSALGIRTFKLGLITALFWVAVKSAQAILPSWIPLLERYESITRFVRWDPGLARLCLGLGLLGTFSAVFLYLPFWLLFRKEIRQSWYKKRTN
jgi:hypothetical protein